jgi:hypothetical protein
MRHTFSELRHARAVRITMIDGFAGTFLKFFNDSGRGRNIWITDAQIDQVHSAGQSGTLSAVDLGE